MLRTLFLHPPSYEGFDGGAGSRYQAKREIRSFWYPTWLAQLAALVPGSKLVDAPPAGLELEDVVPMAKDYELVVLHTSSPSFPGDVKVAEALKGANPDLLVGFVGAKVAVEPEESLLASSAIDFVAREEYDFTVLDIAKGRPLDQVDGITYRDRARRRGTHPGPGGPREHGRAALRHGGLQARPAGGGLLHRLPQAPLPVALHGPWVPVAVHLLSLAADRGRAPLPDPQRRARAGGDGDHPQRSSAGQGGVLRRRHLHGQP